MSTPKTLPDALLQPFPAPGEHDFAPLLSEPFARVWALPASPDLGAPAVRGRLIARMAASAAAEAPMHTARRRRLPGTALAPGLVAQTLYVAPTGRPLRAGEPLRARLIEFGAGATLRPGLLDTPETLQARRLEWLVVSGNLQQPHGAMAPRDYHVTPAGHAAPDWTSPTGGLLFLRESDPLSGDATAPFTVRDAEAGWPDFAPGVQRRVLWQHQGQAALLYLAQPGAQVPNHTHGHDEECLMVQGELFLDDLLLQAGDYQLAPASTGHRITETDSGAVLYAHGDLDLKFVA